MRVFSNKMLVVLPRLCPHTNRNLRLSEAYVNLVRFFQKRHDIETHVVSSAESYAIVPEMEGVKTVLGVHPADINFVNNRVMQMNEDEQDIQYQDAYDAATAKIPLKRGLSIEERFAEVSARERVAVRHVAKTHYGIVADFENPWNSVYNLKPKVAKVYLRVSTHNQTVKCFLVGKPFDDICGLLSYDGAHKPLGCWDDDG
jgi:hypothetical protein